MALPPLYSLYVGDLDPTVTEGQLIEAFSGIKSFVSASLCKNSASGQSLSYGYVNFNDLQHATEAIETMNHKFMNGKTIRVTWSQRGSGARTSGIGNVFLKNLNSTIDNSRLQEIFSQYGSVLSSKVSMSQDGKSRGYGFVQFGSAESAQNAIEKVNGSIIEGKEIYVGHFVKKSDRIQADPNAEYKNLYIKNLDEDVTEERLGEKFSKFGKITSLVISKDSEGISKGFGFVCFENSDDAKRAKESMNETQLGSKVLYVAKAQKKAERHQTLRLQYEERSKERILKYKDLNVYVKNINDDVGDNQLKEHFSQCGTVSSAKIMRDANGISKGFGFVCFSYSEEANKAIRSLHGIMFHEKPLYVAIAQGKEERRAFLQHLYAQPMIRLPGPSGAVIAPNLYYPGQDYMFQPPGMRPEWRTNGYGPLVGPAFQPALLPMIPDSPRQYRQKKGWMNEHMIPHSAGHPMLLMPNSQRQNQFVKLHTNSGYQQRAGHARYTTHAHLSVINNGYSAASATTSQSAANASQESKDLSSMLAAASPDERKLMLGERLYPLVDKLQHGLAAIITEMLLEMDNSELLLLLESPESLAVKVEEAERVLELSKTKADGQEVGHPDLLSDSSTN